MKNDYRRKYYNKIRNKLVKSNIKEAQNKKFNIFQYYFPLQLQLIKKTRL